MLSLHVLPWWKNTHQTMWLRCGLAVTCTNNASEYSSQSVQNTNVHMERDAFVRELSNTYKDTHARHINTGTNQEHTFKNKYTHPLLQTHTESWGMLLDNLFMLEKNKLKSAHQFYEEGGNWIYSSSFLTLFYFYVVKFSQLKWTVPLVDLHIFLFSGTWHGND